MMVPFFLGDESEEHNQVLLRILTGREKETVLVELCSPDDLFFYYDCTLTHHDLATLNHSFNLHLTELA